MKRGRNASVALLVACSIGIGPLLPKLHLVFSPHPHHFCVEHQRFERVLSEGQACGERHEHDERLAHPKIDPQTVALQARPAGQARDQHDACPLANLSNLSFSPPSHRAALAALSPREGTEKLGSRHTLERPSIAILSRAPKQSPPSPIA